MPALAPVLPSAGSPANSAAEGGPKYVFPFETGLTPTTAGRNLEYLESELRKDRTVATEESQAAAKLEGA
jgi:hypothetical protein